jgi:hypothetical protein
MIVTHTQNMQGQKRVYLGGKGSLECWIEPRTDSTSWSFHVDEAVTGNRLSDDDKRVWAIHTLKMLCDELNVAPEDLAAVPFEVIAALHAGDPYAGRRVASPRRQSLEQGFMATTPHVRRPQADYTANDASGQRFRHR